MDRERREQIAAELKALGHPLRIAVLEAVDEGQALTRVGEEYDVTRQTVQDHVETLAEADLLVQEGGHRYALTERGRYWLSEFHNSSELLDT